MLRETDDDEEEEEEETSEQPTAEVIFVLEMVLNLKTKNKRWQSKLPRVLRGLVGVANSRFAQGEHEEAILMYTEIIRQNFEPFSALAVVYENEGDMEKSL